jgi:hypothetical protein
VTQYNTQNNNTEHNDKRCYLQQNVKPVMLIVIMQIIVMLSVLALSKVVRCRLKCPIEWVE